MALAYNLHARWALRTKRREERQTKILNACFPRCLARRSYIIVRGDQQQRPSSPDNSKAFIQGMTPPCNMEWRKTYSLSYTCQFPTERSLHHLRVHLSALVERDAIPKSQLIAFVCKAHPLLCETCNAQEQSSIQPLRPDQPTMR